MAISEVFDCDCMEYMKTLPDKFFDLAIVDPPYFDGPDKLGYFGAKYSTTKVKRINYPEIGRWEIPDNTYFIELERVSNHQIVWGINYFKYFPKSPGRIIWDKKNDSSTFSKAEIASCSQIETVQMFRYMWNGMLQENMKDKEQRIHPTQKPVALYRWLLKNYAKPGDKIFDSHMGSQSIRIACHQMGFDFWGCELDEDYFKAGCERYENEAKQIRLFSC